MPAPLAAAEPGRHATQTSWLELPGMGLAVPAVQARHEALVTAPSVGLNVPAGQSSKVMLALAAPTVEQKPPIGQSEHSNERSPAEKEPARHAGQLSLASAVSLL